MKIAELFTECRDTDIRDAQHYMPLKQIPDLGWKHPDEASPEKDLDPTPSTKKDTTKPTAQVAVIEVPKRSKERIQDEILTTAVTATMALVYTMYHLLIHMNLFQRSRQSGNHH